LHSHASAATPTRPETATTNDTAASTISDTHGQRVTVHLVGEVDAGNGPAVRATPGRGGAIASAIARSPAVERR
jgi:hypothetical protein